MKHLAGKIVLSVFCVVLVLLASIFAFIYALSGLTYMYFPKQTSIDICLAIIVSVLSLAVISFLGVMMFVPRKGRIFNSICAAVLIIATCVGGCFSAYGIYYMKTDGMSSGCSYTEDVENYGKYDGEISTDHFPNVISRDMRVVKYAYYFKHTGNVQLELYLEVKFDDFQTMYEYVQARRNKFIYNGSIYSIEYTNPYNPEYTDLIYSNWLEQTKSKEKVTNNIKFGNDGYRYVEMEYAAVSYSYSELTMIYSYVNIGKDIELGDKLARDQYYPAILNRFNVEWDTENNFIYKHDR